MKSEKHPITQAVSAVILGIVRDRENLDIDEQINDHALKITVTTSLDDYRILVGKSGRNVQALQRIVRRAGERNQMTARFELKTNHMGETVAIHDFKPNPNFNDATLVRLFNNICDLVEIKTEGVGIRFDSAAHKLHITVPSSDVEDRATISDLNDLFFPYGFTQGRKVDIKPNEPGG